MNSETALRIIELAAQLVIAGKQPTGDVSDDARNEVFERWVEKLKGEFEKLKGSSSQ